MSAIYRGTERFIVFVIGDTSTRAAANCRSVLSSKNTYVMLFSDFKLLLGK